MIFTYYIQSGPAKYSTQTDEDFYNEGSFEYEVEEKSVRRVFAEFLAEEYLRLEKDFNKEEKLKIKQIVSEIIAKMVSDFDINYDDYKEELKDYFKDEAIKYYKEIKE